MSIHLAQILEALSIKKNTHHLYMPGVWIDYKTTKPTKIDYASFLADKITEIIRTGNLSIPKSDNWTKTAVVYNVFIRFFSAYDHDQDGKIGDGDDDITLNNYGVRETGTILKTIALLPYLKKLGINTIHLLPITEIGEVGRKGDLGSPYAIKYPFKIDPNIGDPIVELSVEDQYKSLIEAAHLLGMRIVQEFIFRTAAIDAEWSLEHPEWFYWIKDKQNYGPPIFTSTELEQIIQVPKGKGKYVAPDKAYRNQYEIPTINTDYKKLHIPSAFADWPPNDLQPPWSDVTYLRLYNYDFNMENNYNYIAYNTVRYYDPELAKKEHINNALWEKITDIIPFYQQNFGIDGAMIDMGHALPNLLKSKIIKKARSNDATFAFWDENFSNKIETKIDGYDAVIGDAWYKITKRNGFRSIILASDKEKPLPFFGTSETHNSPRFGCQKVEKKKASWLLFTILPNAIPFIHNGFELNEHLPVNTGLNFNKTQIDELGTKRLPLFYKNTLDWDTQANIIPFIQKIATLQKTYPWIFDKNNISLLTTSNKHVLGFVKNLGRQRVIILFNTNFYAKETFEIDQQYFGGYTDLINDTELCISENNLMKKGKAILALRN